jgi:hypothetical protein
VVTLDRRKLAAPVAAQAAAFVVVLVIGGVTHHGAKTPAPAPAPSTTSASPGATTPSARATTPNAAKAQAAKLTVKVVEQGTDGLSLAGSEVKVLRNGTLTAVASGTLNTALDFAANMTAGEYEVCVKPPIGWTSAIKNTHLVHGYICSVTAVGSAPVAVTFQLTPPSTQAGT